MHVTVNLLIPILAHFKDTSVKFCSVCICVTNGEIHYCDICPYVTNDLDTVHRNVGL